MRAQPIVFILSLMLILIGLAMVPCAIIDMFDRGDDWAVFSLSSLAILCSGALLFIASGGAPERIGTREAFLLTVLVWVLLPIAAAIPLIGSGFNWTDSIFESVSGLTTTGATILSGLDTEARGLLLWRAILQWIGGIGIIVTAIAILPSLGVGGMQLFQLESSDVSGKFLPRVREIAGQIALVYLGLSALCASFYMLADMSAFDAITHAMTTMAAGGYSTHDSSFEYFKNSAAVEVACVFMVLAALPFGAFVLMLHGKSLALWRDPQPRVFLGILVAAMIVLAIYLYTHSDGNVFRSEPDMLRNVVFNVISVTTGTGYAVSDYGQWGAFADTVFLILMFVGGCAGSAACGMKVFRLEIMFRAVLSYARQMLTPNRIAIVRYGNSPVNADILNSVMVFAFLYLTTFAVAAVLLSMTGLDPLTAYSAAATSVSNVGPGLGPVVGPSSTFQSISDPAKWICIIAMLLGRLEFVTVFVVLTPRFWRA